jgi:hypothetical protein
MNIIPKPTLAVEVETATAIRALAKHLTADLPHGERREAAIRDAQANAIDLIHFVCKEHVDRYHLSLDQYELPFEEAR